MKRYMFRTVPLPIVRCFSLYRGPDKSLARPGRKQARKHVRNVRDFNNIETRAVIKFCFSCKAILTETLSCFLPGRAKDLSLPLYTQQWYMLYKFADGLRACLQAVSKVV